MTVTPDVKSELEKIVGNNNVRDEDYILAAYGMDMTVAVPSKADVVVLPGCTEEVSAILKLATEKKIPVTPRASNTLGSGVGLAQGGILLDLGRMDKIIGFDEKTLTVTAQGGCGANMIMQTLKKKGFDLPLQPWFGSGPSIGSWVSATGTGGRIAKYGQATSWVLGMEVVLPTGEIIRTGTAALEACQPFSNFYGNYRLDQFFHRSCGTIGVITEVTCGVIPLPETTTGIAYGFDDMQSFGKAAYEIQRADAATDIEHEDGDLYNEFLKMHQPHPLVLIVTNQGYKEEVARKTEIAKRICEEAGGHPLPDKFAKITWDNAASFDYGAARYGRYAMMSAASTYDSYEQCYRIIKDTLRKYNIKSAWSAWSSWPAWVIGWVVAAYDFETQRADVDKAYFEIYRQLLDVPNCAISVISDPYMKVVKDIKNLLDPAGIMNPSAWGGVSGESMKMLKQIPLNQ